MNHSDSDLLNQVPAAYLHVRCSGQLPQVQRGRAAASRGTAIRTAIGGPLLLVAVACQSSTTPPTDRVSIGGSAQRAADQEFVREPFTDQARRGVIRQRALFDAHFVHESDRLSSLGRRDVAILAEALRESGGRISVRRGSSSEALYVARVAQVRAAFARFGIDPARMTIDDGQPGGLGALTEEALMIRADIRDKPMAPISDAVLPPAGAGTPQAPTP